ncbi:Hachiman antiphage defense system protein HamA [Erwinia amylovora]|uniref:Hachiman antiphage defense system protein HamA n=1 Tax=Erwinia amylovora TaxID=552 RepID=UPI00237A974F|nr:Hachiman antiphage defense system protein HamA [Erwinia amylovora]
MTESVKNSLNTDKLRKENSVILNVNDIKELILDDRIKDDIFRCLSNANSIDNIKGKINIPILIIHECNITSKATCISEAYKKEILDFHKERTVAYFRKNRQKVQSLFGYENIKFHLILFPVPNKKVIIDNFVNSVIFYKEQ